MVVSNGSNDVLQEMRCRVQAQGDLVKKLKADRASEAEVKYAIDELKALKKLLETKEIELNPPSPHFDRSKLEDLLKQRFFYDQSFSIYGGVQGLYDYGPMGCAMKSNLLSAWRQHFVLEDHLLEVDCSMLTPYAVLQSSGHVDRFTDLMVKDVKTGECFRADHLIKENLQERAKLKKCTESEKEEIRRILTQLDNLGKVEFDDIIRRFAIKSPTTNNDLTEAQEFNLMFATMIGPTGQCKGFLRPETAQGIFVNFQRLLQFNQGRIPFGAAQIGSAFRNEISPRSGLIRVREFTMAEIEYFVDPNDKRHPKFKGVRDLEMTLYSACDQLDGKSPVRMTIGEAVDKGMVANETLGYFMARIHQFLLLIGVDEKRLRFRQHLSNEMAHYACDCWDAECQTSYGWIECVGCADRSCYDLSQHSKATGARLVAEKRLTEPRLVKTHDCVLNKQALGKAFRGEAKTLIDHLSQLSLDDKLSLGEQISSTGKAELKLGNKSFEVDSSMVQVKEKEVTMHVEEIVPNVIEPSFGIGRIMYAIFEHSFCVRDGDEQRTYLSLSPILAPYKCSVLPLSNQPDFLPFVQKLSSALTRHGVSHRVDESSGSIGRRYARTDQIAIPYGITIDFDTVNKTPASATLRERDSMKQIRVPLDELPPLVNDLSNGVLSWADAQTKYPSFEQQETAKSGNVGAVANDEEPLVVTDEWQSVSEDLDEVNKHADHEQDQWSSATETPDAEVNIKSVQTASGHSKEIQPSEGKAKSSASPPIHRLPRSWEECGPAIQRHYQAIRARAKADTSESAVVTSPLTGEPDHLNHTCSGYEADHEDNVSRSLHNERVPVNRESDTFGDLSPTVPSLNEANDAKLFDQGSTAGRAPVLHHGLFVGDGWPEEPAQKPQKEKKSKPSKLPDASPDVVEQKVETKPKHGENWLSVLARLAEQARVPELNQFPANIETPSNHLLLKQAGESGQDLDDMMLNREPLCGMPAKSTDAEIPRNSKEDLDDTMLNLEPLCGMPAKSTVAEIPRSSEEDLNDTMLNLEPLCGMPTRSTVESHSEKAPNATPSFDLSSHTLDVKQSAETTHEQPVDMAGSVPSEETFKEVTKHSKSSKKKKHAKAEAKLSLKQSASASKHESSDGSADVNSPHLPLSGAHVSHSESCVVDKPLLESTLIDPSMRLEDVAPKSPSNFIHSHPVKPTDVSGDRAINLSALTISHGMCERSKQPDDASNSPLIEPLVDAPWQTKIHGHAPQSTPESTMPIPDVPHSAESASSEQSLTVSKKAIEKSNKSSKKKKHHKSENKRLSSESDSVAPTQQSEMQQHHEQVLDPLTDLRYDTDLPSSNAMTSTYHFQPPVKHSSEPPAEVSEASQMSNPPLPTSVHSAPDNASKADLAPSSADLAQSSWSEWAPSNIQHPDSAPPMGVLDPASATSVNPPVGTSSAGHGFNDYMSVGGPAKTTKKKTHPRAEQKAENDLSESLELQGHTKEENDVVTHSEPGTVILPGESTTLDDSKSHQTNDLHQKPLSADSISLPSNEGVSQKEPTVEFVQQDKAATASHECPPKGDMDGGSAEVDGTEKVSPLKKTRSKRRKPKKKK